MLLKKDNSENSKKKKQVLCICVKSENCTDKNEKKKHKRNKRNKEGLNLNTTAWLAVGLLPKPCKQMI